MPIYEYRCRACRKKTTALAGVDENDPASMAKLMKKMSEATGENLGEDFEQAIQDEACADNDSNE